MCVCVKHVGKSSTTDPPYTHDIQVRYDTETFVKEARFMYFSVKGGSADKRLA